MPEPRPDAHALLDSSFHASPNLKSHKHLPRRSNELRSIFPTVESPKQHLFRDDHDTFSQIDSPQATSLTAPGAVKGADSGLPPTPPSNSHDEESPSTFNAPPHADSVVASLLSKNSSLSTPVNQRSPPTPDPSPPRTSDSVSLPDRPVLLAYPSSRAESFKTAKEDQSSSRSNTPPEDRLSIVPEDRGLGLAFEREDSDATPTSRMQNPFTDVDTSPRDSEERGDGHVENLPNREWDTNLMRNVTVRRKRNTKPSPQKDEDCGIVPATASTPRRSSSLRERVEASKSSPQTPSIENFARSIGWPAEANGISKDDPREANTKRSSVSSLSSAVVEAMVIVTPPQRRRTLRHSGKNLAYRRHGDLSAELSSATHSNRTSLNSEDVPLHRLIHKRATIANPRNRVSSESDALGMYRTASPSSVQKRARESVSYTLAHQASIRNVLQPAAEIMSRSNSVTRSYTPEKAYPKRIVSAPEPTRMKHTHSPAPQTLFNNSPETPKSVDKSFPAVPVTQRALSPISASQTEVPPLLSPKVRSDRRMPQGPKISPNVNKSLPKLPILSVGGLDSKEIVPHAATKPVDDNDRQVPLTSHDALAVQLPEQAIVEVQEQEPQEFPSPRQRGSSADRLSTVRRGSISSRGRSEERRRSSTSQERTSTSRDTFLHPNPDRLPIEEVPRHSFEWHANDHDRRISFDRSTIRTEEHAMARHLFAQTTPFSQFSDTPIEVSEATAVSIFPHNNHSLLVVQQVARSNTLEQGVPEDINQPSANPTAPAMASLALLSDVHDDETVQLDQPTLTFEPSTPPMQLALSVPGAVDSPLKNPRAAPEPPVIKFIPPTPAAELELQLQPTPPGPPKRSDSYPQRRLSLVQRARRYSDNLISPLLARAASSRGRHASESHTAPRIPTVNDEDGSLHPFWRPRGFWDGFDDSDSESDEDVLPRGGDTSDVEDVPSPNPRKLNTLGRRLTNGLKSPGGFLIGNSLGMERSGTNRRRPHISLPARSPPRAPRILVQSPTFPLRSRSPRIEKRGSRTSLRSSMSLERSRASRKDAWRKGKRIPGVKLQVQYIGLSGVKERLRERKAEKRREDIRKSIGSRYYVESGTNVA